MDIISKRIGEITTTKFNSLPSSARLTLTDELLDMGVDVENDKVSISLIQNGKDKQIVIERIR